MNKGIVLLCLLLAAGCKGKKGNQGTPGLNAPQDITMGGSVISDDFTVSDPRFKLADNISVYLSDGAKITESPYFLPSLGINTYYLADPTSGTVRIFNAQKAAATQYIISIII